jgi:hypothetical protein
LIRILRLLRRQQYRPGRICFSKWVGLLYWRRRNRGLLGTDPCFNRIDFLDAFALDYYQIDIWETLLVNLTNHQVAGKHFWLIGFNNKFNAKITRQDTLMGKS